MDYEKDPKPSITSVDSKEVAYAREELVDPAKEETLHRGLSARQISMIAVSSIFSLSLLPMVFMMVNSLVALLVQA